MRQGEQPWPIRPWRVATNVGAGLPREAPRGRRSISKALKKRNRMRYYLEKWAVVAALVLVFIYI